MRLAHRLWLFGAALPTVLLAGTLAVVGVGLDKALIHGIDDALRSQAAVEAVSVFDAGFDAPHLHIDRSELARRLGEPPASTALYGAGGLRMLVWPADAALPLTISEIPAKAQLTTVSTAEGEMRELLVPLRGRDRRAYLLMLRRSLAERDAALQAYVSVSLLASVAVALALLLVAGAQVRSIGGRVEALLRHVARVGEGDLDAQLPRDDAGDEISALRDALAEATDARRRAAAAEARLLADAAHELRTPLAAMRLELDLASKPGRSPESLRQAFDSVGEEVDRLARIAEHLLQFDEASRSRPGEEVDLVGLFEQRLQRALPLLESRGVALQRAAGPASVVLRGDADALGRAIDNLLSNAARHAAGVVRSGVTLRDGRVLLSIEDDGPGVPEAEVEAIFAPFHRRERDRDGSGLGLAIVREVAMRHSGEVQTGRSPLGGARFVLDFPLEPASTSASAHASASRP